MRTHIYVSILLCYLSMLTPTHIHTLCFEDAYSKSVIAYTIILFCVFMLQIGFLNSSKQIGIEKGNNQGTKNRIHLTFLFVFSRKSFWNSKHTNSTILCLSHYFLKCLKSPNKIIFDVEPNLINSSSLCMILLENTGS